jgi:hypothetical protein
MNRGPPGWILAVWYSSLPGSDGKWPVKTFTREINMKRFAILLGTAAWLGLAGITVYGQIPGLSGGGDSKRGDNKANVQNNKDNGNKDNKDHKPDNNNARRSNNNNSGNANKPNDNDNRRGSNNNSNPGNNKNDNKSDDKDRGNSNNKNDNKNRDGVNIGGKDGINIDAGKGGIAVDSQRNKDRDNDRKDSNRRDDNDRRRDDLTKRGRIGDGDWDKFGIGRLDDNRYKNQSGNQWRYKRYGNDWFYWAPAGYWMYYGNNHWNRYDPDSYATYYYGDGNYVPQQAAVPANFNGPYYEDSNGFYYMNGNQRVYDPSIRRNVNAAVN